MLFAVAALTNINWLGVTLGEPASDVLAKFGQTGFFSRGGVSGAETGDLTAISYSFEHAHGTLDISFRNGRVSTIGMRGSAWDGSIPPDADPHGITLTMTPDDLVAKLGKSSATDDSGRRTEIYNDTTPGVTWHYSFYKAKMTNIWVQATSATMDSLPSLPPPALRTGATLDDALLNVAPDEASGAQNERLYLLSRRCVGGAPIPLERRQGLINKNDTAYDRLSLSYDVPPGTHELYFDITPFFGKL